MKLKIHLIFLATISLFSCKGDDSLKTEHSFMAFFEGPTNVISSLDSGSTVMFNTHPITTQQNDSIAHFAIANKNIQWCNLLQMDVRTQKWCNVTLSFVDSIDFYIMADGLPDRYLTSFTGIDSNVNLQGWTTPQNTDDLADYLKKGSFSVRSVLKSDETVVEDIGLIVRVFFDVRGVK